MEKYHMLKLSKMNFDREGSLNQLKLFIKEYINEIFLFKFSSGKELMATVEYINEDSLNVIPANSLPQLNYERLSLNLPLTEHLSSVEVIFSFNNRHPITFTIYSHISPKDIYKDIMKGESIQTS